MKNNLTLALVLLLGWSFMGCSNLDEANVPTSPIVQDSKLVESDDEILDNRVSLHLNPRQKQHQLENMRSHLVAVQTLIELIGQDNFELASKVAKTELGSSTEMQLMCASFGNKNFEDMGTSFHASADDLSEILQAGDRQKSMQALSLTMSYCISCHASYKQ